MGVEQEMTVRAFLTELEGEQFDPAQIDRVLDRMSRDARYQVYAWEDPLVGHDAVRAELVRQIPLFGDFRTEIVTMGSVENMVFVERLDSMTINDKPVTLHVAAVFEIDGDGKSRGLARLPRQQGSLDEDRSRRDQRGDARLQLNAGMWICIGPVGRPRHGYRRGNGRPLFHH